MQTSSSLTLKKKERLCSRTLIERLFSGGGSRSLSAFPLRVVYMVKNRENLEPQAQMLISVPKRYFKRAVKRNRVKRQVREAFRHNRQLLIDELNSREKFDEVVVMAFIWLDDKLHDSAEVDAKVSNLLKRISEKV